MYESQFRQVGMSIPWVTALQVARKLLPVVVDKAPELLKTLSQLRATVPIEEQPTTDPILTALHQQIDAHRQTIAVQANTIDDLQTTLRTTQRSLSVTRSMLAAMALLALAILAYLLFRT